MSANPQQYSVNSMIAKDRDILYKYHKKLRDHWLSKANEAQKTVQIITDFFQKIFDLCEIDKNIAKTFRRGGPNNSIKSKNSNFLKDCFPTVNAAWLVDDIPFELTQITQEMEEKLTQSQKDKTEKEQKERIEMAERDANKMEQYQKTSTIKPVPSKLFNASNEDTTQKQKNKHINFRLIAFQDLNTPISREEQPNMSDLSPQRPNPIESQTNSFRYSTEVQPTSAQLFQRLITSERVIGDNLMLHQIKDTEEPNQEPVMNQKRLSSYSYSRNRHQGTGLSAEPVWREKITNSMID